MPRKVTGFDKLDIDLLSIVVRNSRLTLEQKSKLVHRSKEVVLYRLQKLQRLGVIQKYGAMINARRLGYASYNFLFELTKVSSEKIKQFEEFLASYPSIRYAAKTSGSWDYEVSILVKDHQDFDKFFTLMHEQFGSIVKSNHFHIRTKTLKADNYTRVINSSISIPKRWIRHVKATKESDEVDYLILKCVCADSSKSVREIALECNVSPEQVRYRLQKLEDGIINNYTAQLNLEKFGVQEYSIVLKLANNTKDIWKKLSQLLSTSVNVSHAVKIVGEYDARIHVLCENQKELENWITNLRDSLGENIDQINFSVRHKTIRRDSFPLGKHAITSGNSN